ncbi:MAG: ATP-dependent protease ATPase subunit HslU [Myxococcota bacterium]
MTDLAATFTPRETVGELDRYIIGQDKAKRAVAVALRNRWRRQQVGEDLRDEISPKNIIMIGPTGVGKTEIARRLAKLARAPFVKVEASKFTEVGYVGRDVESMVRDLVEIAIKLVREEQVESVQVRAEEAADERLAKMLVQKDVPPPPPPQGQFGPIIVPPPPGGKRAEPQLPSTELEETRKKLRAGELEDEEVEMNVADTGNPFMTIFGQHGMEELNLKDMLGSIPGFQGRTKRRRMKVRDARNVLRAEESDKLIDLDAVQREAIRRTEQSGIVFLDEIDKVAGRQTSMHGPDVSREGVQRDLLPIVEGSTVSTKYGPLKTDHILFIAAGAFHVAKVADLIPELQGRFPIRVELESLAKAEFARILTEPKNSLTKQYAALMATEGIELEFTEDAVDAIAGYAETANTRAENIGARRLHTIMEALLEELSFDASERTERVVRIDRDVVVNTLSPIMDDGDLAKYIL